MDATLAHPPVSRLARIRGIVLIVIGGAVAITMAAGMFTGVGPRALALFGCVLALGIGFAVAGVCFVVRGAMPAPVKWAVLGLMAVTVGFALQFR